LPRRPSTGRPTLLAVGALQLICVVLTSVAHATTPVTKPAPSRTALGGFVKDRALARVLGETLFHDTQDVMSECSSPCVPPSASTVSPAADAVAAGVVTAMPLVAGATAAGGGFRDNSAVGRVARAVLAHEKLDKYLWLIRRAYSDTLWKGGDRARIEQHFPLIWRTSILLYQATLNASPHRVRVCTPADNGDAFDCRDEIERVKIVPIPSQAPLVRQPHEAAIG
jgi:hypothetical protein